MNNIALEAKGIIKRFPGVTALKKVDFNVKAGEIHALCGENGAGKSTLMHILSGVYRADEGIIAISGNETEILNQHHANSLGISIVYQERSLINRMSVAENIYAARQPVGILSVIKWKELYESSRKLLKELGLDIEPRKMIDKLSPAMQQMVEIAKALSMNPKVLILDEPTATITENEVGILFKLLNRLKEQGVAIIYISHRLAEIFEIADRVTVFKDGRHIETAAVKDINYDWIVSKMVGRDLVMERCDGCVDEEAVLECRKLQSNKFRNIDFYLNQSEILSFAGLAGAGRTELMRAIFGADKYDSGEILVSGENVRIRTTRDAIKAGLGYLPEDRKAQGLFLEMDISDNIVSANLNEVSRGLLLDRSKVKRIAENYRKSLSIVTPDISQYVVNLSGGNQQKVVLAKWLLLNPKILIVDEPTRGVDVGAKQEIYEMLRELTRAGTSIIVVSSDLMEVLTISDRIYVMHNGRITGELDGSEATEEEIMRYASGITTNRKDV